MALITCTECGKEFSDKAAACPNCGCPTEEMVQNTSHTPKDILLSQLHKKYPINPEHAVKEYASQKGISKAEAKKIVDEYYKTTPPPKFKGYLEEQNAPKKGFWEAMSDWQKESARQEALRQQKKEEKTKLKCPSCKSTNVLPVDTQKKFSAGKFLVGNTVGYALAGPVGGIVGAATGIKGKNGKTKFICQSCGKVFEKKI